MQCLTCPYIPSRSSSWTSTYANSNPDPFWSRSSPGSLNFVINEVFPAPSSPTHGKNEKNYYVLHQHYFNTILVFAFCICCHSFNLLHCCHIRNLRTVYLPTKDCNNLKLFLCNLFFLYFWFYPTEKHI